MQANSFLWMVLAACAACAATTTDATAPTAHPQPATGRHVLIVGGTIRVAARADATAQALYVEDGRVVAVGAEAEVRAAARAPFETLDLAGAVALPGLIDAHGHLEGLGTSLEEVDLRGLTSYAALVEKVAARAAGLPAGSWIEGRGWDQNLWPQGQFPHHATLSAAVPDHPVLLRRVDGHALLANQRALEMAGLSGPQASESPVQGGRMLLGPDRRPTGVFVDSAMDLIGAHVPAPEVATRRRRVLLAQRELFAHGITGVHDMGEDLELVGLLADLASAGELKLEVAGYISQSTLEGGWKLPVAASNAARGGPASFRVVGAKLYMDGALGSRGAALLADYSDEPGNRGLAFLEPAQLDALLAMCDERGLQPAVHAIGDLANRRVLDAYARRMASSNSFAVLRPRIEHAQVVAREDWPRFRTLGVVPSMQPTHATSDMPWAPARLGAQRIEGAYAWKHLDPEGRSLAFGSDFPVELCDPLAGLYSAITCADSHGQPPEGFRPDQRLDAATALAAFTGNAARAARQELEFGSLEVGHFANLSVLDLDPLQCEPARLLGGGHVRMTIVRGERVYRADAGH